MTQTLPEGGAVLIAIGVISLVGWTLILHKWLELRAERSGGLRWAKQSLRHLAEGDRAAALALCDQHEGAMARLLAEALRTDEPRRRFFERHIRPLLEAEATGLRRHLGTIGAVGTAAPLLGLLGTVLGMIETFEVLTVHGTVLERMARGISSALVTTQAGLVVALPILLLHRYLSARVSRWVRTMELYVKKVETIRCRD